MANPAAASSSFVRVRTFILVAVPLAVPIAYSVFFVPWRQEAALVEGAQRKAAVIGALLALNAAAAVQFEDEKGVNALLENVRADPECDYVTAENKDGKQLGAYGDLRHLARHAVGPTAQSVVEDDIIHVVSPVMQGREIAGAVRAGFSTKRIVEEGRTFRTTAVALSILVLAIAAVIAVFLGRGFANLFAQLRDSILRTAQRVDQVVGQLAAATAQQTAAAGEESSALHETNATAAQVGEMATSAAARASALTNAGARAESAATTGLDAVASASKGMRDVRDQMATIVTAISALSERAAAIGDIASTVGLLAERSNLLALNAAIEAARAGAQGRGFAVVAQEMRSLADGSNRSANQVKEIIGEIQSAISRAVSDVREGERRVQSAESLADNAGQSINRFADVTKESAGVGREIAQAAAAQSAAIEQMVESITHATQAGSTQLETTKQVEETSRQLRTLSKELLDVLAGTDGTRPGLS
jgi:methyl-accepting chemotaxis protein